MQDKHERRVDRLIQEEKARTYKRQNKSLNDRLRAVENEKRVDRLEAREEHRLYIRRNADLEFKYSPIAEVPDDVKLPADYFSEVYHKTEYNKIYADYYYQRYLDTNLQKYADISDRIEHCHKSWFGDHYKIAGVFNAKRVFHCHNRWCWLCNHLNQAKRLYKYHLKFEKLLSDYDLYHLVFTIRNVKGEELKDSLARMHDTMYRIIRYFQGRGKITGVDFAQYGFVGAIRSFEIVINPTDYHPHIHCLFMLKKGLELPKTEINKYSFSGVTLVRKFSKLEILLQKMFYLAYHKQKLNMQNINALKVGYSCMMDLAEGDKWHEVFKYATKMSKDGASACTYEQFVLLDDILRRMKMIQGYGIFYDDKDDEDDSDPYVEILFEKVLVLLEKTEMPERDVNFQLEKIVDEVHNKNMTVISKKMSYKYLQSLYAEFHKEYNDNYTEPF